MALRSTDTLVRQFPNWRIYPACGGEITLQAVLPGLRGPGAGSFFKTAVAPLAAAAGGSPFQDRVQVRRGLPGQLMAAGERQAAAQRRSGESADAARLRSTIRNRREAVPGLEASGAVQERAGVAAGRRLVTELKAGASARRLGARRRGSLPKPPGRRTGLAGLERKGRGKLVWRVGAHAVQPDSAARFGIRGGGGREGEGSRRGPGQQVDMERRSQQRPGARLRGVRSIQGRTRIAASRQVVVASGWGGLGAGAERVEEGRVRPCVVERAGAWEREQAELGGVSQAVKKLQSGARGSEKMAPHEWAGGEQRVLLCWNISQDGRKCRWWCGRSLRCYVCFFCFLVLLCFY